MLVDIINKILIMLFFISALNVGRHIYYFIQTYMKMFDNTEESAFKYILKPKSLFLLCISLAYLLTSIFTGIKI